MSSERRLDKLRSSHAKTTSDNFIRIRSLASIDAQIISKETAVGNLVRLINDQTLSAIENRFCGDQIVVSLFACLLCSLGQRAVSSRTRRTQMSCFMPPAGSGMSGMKTFERDSLLVPPNFA